MATTNSFIFQNNNLSFKAILGQSFNHSIIIIHSIKGGLILIIIIFMYSRWGTRMILQYAKEIFFPLRNVSNPPPPSVIILDGVISQFHLP